PHGAFTLQDRRDRPLVFIAGGVGFAPIMGMLRALRDEGHAGGVTLIYGERNLDQILYRDEIRQMEREMGLRANMVLAEPPPGWTGEAGILTREVLARCLGRLAPNALYFVCGPLAMMDSVEDSLARLGAPEASIVSERFK